MAVEDNVKAGQGQIGDALSPEDLAWVDSCLIKDSEILDSNWNALKGALLEIVDSHPEPLSYSAAMIESSPEGTDMEILPFSEETQTAESLGRNDDDEVVSFNLKSGKIKERYQINKKIVSQLLYNDDPAETFVMDPFLPSFNDDERVSEVFDSGFNSDLVAVEMEPLSDDIFKVWDVVVPAEKDELVNAIVDTSSQLISSAFGYSAGAGEWNLNDESLDNLVSAIADLSLDQNSSKNIYTK
ncbi:hypothetical protein Dsin_026676 [Dipteronia sinensis]|uniref:Uncharacterized protein n=1 Tax=Dipteronia sinensis TaxID=43782 RepID=A0AAD9ZYR6_9ROSI|nr:hypothetical protein Dsin_026676 [Dipteronia sinensis]